MTPWWRFTWDLARETKRLSLEVGRLKDAYTRLSDAYYDKATALEREEQRAADMALLASEPCLSCEVLTAERDDALLERDAARQVSVWLEQLGWGNVRDGEAT